MELCNLIDVCCNCLLTDLNKLGALDISTVANYDLSCLVWSKAEEMLKCVILESLEGSTDISIFPFIGKLVGLHQARYVVKWDHLILEPFF